MKLHQLRLGRGNHFGMAFLFLLSLTAPALADSGIILPSVGYRATDRLTDIDPKGFDVFGDQIAVYADDNLKIYNRNTWEMMSDLGDMEYSVSTKYLSFVTFDPSGDSLWVGYTVGGNVDDRIYNVALTGPSPAWNHVATLASNYDLAFSGATPYVSGPNSSEWGADNAIWRLDTSGADQHALVANVGGFAAGMAFDSMGNLYYGTNLGLDDTLVKFTNEQVNAGEKTLIDAETLCLLPSFGSDVEVDAANHVLFATNETDVAWNQLSSTLAMWYGTSGASDNYTILGTQGANHWYTVVHAVDDITSDGVVYLDDGGTYWQPVLGLAEIASIPEPSSLMLIVIGICASMAWHVWRRMGR